MKMYDPFPRNHDTPTSVNVCAFTRDTRVIGYIQVTKARPGVRVLKSGKKRITVK